MATIEIIALIVAGLFVGFINTLAGGGSIISLSLLMFLGLPAGVANGTNRIAIMIQNIIATTSFKQQKVLEVRKTFMLGIPAIIGSLLGAWIAVDLSEKVLKTAMAIIMLFMLVFILYNPKKMLSGNDLLQNRKVNLKNIIIFFLIGVYGGFIQVGVGYILLTALILSVGYSLVKANAAKVMIVLMYLPFSLVIFILNDQVNWKYGLIMAIGSIIGAFIASRLAVKKGVNFIRYVIIAVILLTASHLFGFIDMQSIFNTFIK